MHLNLMAPMFPQLDVNIPEGWWKQDAQLDLDFANKRAYNKFTQFRGRPDSILTYTSPSPKLVYGDDGVLRYAPHNLLTYSEQFDNAAWVKVNVTVSGSTIQCGSGGTVHRISQVVAPTSVRSRVYYDIKAGTHPYAQILDGANSANYATFDLSTGTVGATGANTTASITALGDGFYRCQVEFGATNLPNNTTYLGFADTAAAGYSSSFSAIGTETIIAARGQLQLLPCVSTTYIGPTTSAAVYSLPIDHDPITHAPLGVLIEEQRTNLLTYSEQLDNAAWTRGNIAAFGSGSIANAIAAPDGTTTADKIVEAATTATHNMAQNATIVSATVYTYSVYAKAAERSWICLEGGGGSGGFSVWFNLATGAVGTISGTTAGNVSIVALPNGWYRCIVTDTSTSTSGAYRYFICDADNNQSYTGDGTSGIYLWGAQLEAGAFPTSYIPTVASQVTRAADQVSILTSAFAFSATVGTFIAEGHGPGSAAIYTLVGGASGLPQVGFNLGALASSIRAVVDLAQVVGGNLSPTVQKVGFAYQSGNSALVTNGGTVATDADAFTLSTGNLGIGYDALVASYRLNGHIKRLTYFPTRKSDAELQGLTI